MDETSLQKTLDTFTEHLLILERNLAELRASVTVLKGILAMQLTPDDPKEGAKQIHDLEDRVLKSDPNASARQQAAAVIEAVKLWRRYGGGGKHEA